MTFVLLQFALAASPIAWGGYGDISPDGYPNWGERSLHMWTNAVRVDPEAFADEYLIAYQPCSFEDDFQVDEQQPKELLYYDFHLNDAARFHTDDMQASGVFSHDSSDGTSFFERVQRYYGDSSWVGENIAMGYGSAFDTIFHGWMCSPGHRSNIMQAAYNELGTGVLGYHYTQDFAAGLVETTSPVAMAVHDPEEPVDEAIFWADWGDMAPDRYDLVLNGQTSPLTLTYGEPERGMYSTTMTVMPGCNAYYFYWELGDEAGTFPEGGSYLFGDCEESTMWTEEQIPFEDLDTGGGAWEKSDLNLIGCGCAAPTGRPEHLGWWVLLVGLIARRRT